MNSTAKNILTAFCCTAMLASFGCSPQGELSVLGLYDSQGQALAGDQCDDLLFEAANATDAEIEDAREAYRECVEQALHEDGRNGECRDRDDTTCDVILDEIGNTLERLRNEAGQDEPPRCDAPRSNGEVALCHLIAAYEACELDRDNDGDPDVDHCTDGSQECPPPAGECGPDDANCEPKPHECDRADSNCAPEPCHAEDGQCEPKPGECDPTDPNIDCAPRPDDCTNADGERCESTDQTEPGGSCDDVRHAFEQSGEEDREFWKRERPECFDSNTPGGEGTDGGTEPNPTSEFCAHLLEELEQATTDQEAAELREIYERECVK